MPSLDKRSQPSDEPVTILLTSDLLPSGRESDTQNEPKC
jgi:hypothetical protein